MDVKEAETEVITTLRPTSLLKRMATPEEVAEPGRLSLRRTLKRHYGFGSPCRRRRGEDDRLSLFTENVLFRATTIERS